MRKRFFWFLLMIIFLIPVLLPFFRSGFFVTDDGEWMIIRLSDFHRSVVDFQVPPRWAGRLNHSYGYPVFNFLYPGMLYFGETFHLLGFGFVNSVKALFVTSFIFSAFFTFLWIKERFKDETGALVASLFFTFLPYRLFDVFRRGSLGEATALTFAPLFFWAVEKDLLWLEALSFGLMIVSHNTMALLFLPVLFFYLLLRKKGKGLDLKQLALPFLLGLGLAAFFWMPALLELPLTQFKQIAISQPEHYFLTSQTIPLIGLAGVFVLLLNSPFLLKKIKKIDLFFYLIYPLSIFFSLHFSAIFWTSTPLKSLVQFPWRFLSLTLPAGAYLAAFFLNRFKGSKKNTVAVFLIGFLLLFSREYLTPTGYIDKGEGFYTTNEGTTTVADEYLPVWVKVKPKERPPKKAEIIKGQAEIKDLAFNSKKILLTVLAKETVTVQINTVYYPGWQAFVNDKRATIDYQNDQGLITLQVPQGEGRVLVKFGETPLRVFSDIISLVSLAIVFLLVFKNFKLEPISTLSS